MKSSKYAALAVTVGLALTVAGCGSSGNATNAAAGGNTQQGYGADGAGGPGGAAGGPGGAGGSGKVAAVSGKTAQVQNQSGQVAVTWTSKTTFTQQVAAKASALKVGDCVVAMPAQTSGQADDPGASGADASVAAATVRITPPVDGSCSGGMRAGRGAGGGTPPSGAPSQAPGGSDSGDAAGRGGARPGGFGALGKVTAVTGSGFTVESERPTTTSKNTTTTTEVTTTATTTWTTTKPATAKAVTVGRCVTSLGKADTTGAITAVSMSLSAPVGGECAVGFGAGGPGRPGSDDQGSDDQGSDDQGSTETQTS